MEVSGQLHTPAGLTGSLWTGYWVDPRTGLDTVMTRKTFLFLPLPGIESR